MSTSILTMKVRLEAGFWSTFEQATEHFYSLTVFSDARSQLTPFIFTTNTFYLFQLKPFIFTTHTFYLYNSHFIFTTQTFYLYNSHLLSLQLTLFIFTSHTFYLYNSHLLPLQPLQAKIMARAQPLQFCGEVKNPRGTAEFVGEIDLDV